MRAIGFAALGLGIAIALSAALGASYRSEASPLGAPTPPPTVTYSFAPDQVTATINDSSADGGTIQLFHYLGSGFVADGAPQPIVASGDTFTFAVSTGTWALTTLDSGGGFVDNQHQFTVQGTPSISSLTWGSTVELRGIGASRWWSAGPGTRASAATSSSCPT